MVHLVSLEDVRRAVAQGHMPVVAHSGQAVQGCVFVVMPPSLPRAREYSAPGGEAHLPQAVAANPGAIVAHARHLPLLEKLGVRCPVAVTEDVRSALGLLARSRYGTDRRCPGVVGITGTNGKTTETYLCEHLFSKLGRRVGVIGTVSYRWPGYQQDAPLTTPGCLALHSMLHDMHAAGVDTVFMEVSSHALDQQRVAGIDFSAALLTNITQDHLDYHQDMEEYFESKALLFRPQSQGGAPLEDKVAVLNADDAYCRKLLAEKRGRMGFGLEKPPVPGSRHLSGEILSSSPAGLRLGMEFEGRRWEIASPLVGAFNAMNLLGVQALALGMGRDPGEMSVLAEFTGVPGRLERVPGAAGLNVFVDYAHTPDALSKAIGALKTAGFARVITVFGCGGNRDRAKRPLMGKAVAALSDIAVLTSDNPRDEEPEAIMADVLPGLAGCARVVTEVDRRKALALALELAGPDDALLVAGKGHETYQLVRGVKYPFSDQAVLRELMS